MQASSSNPYLPSMAQRRSDDSVHTTSEHGSIGLGRPSYTDAFGGSATSGGLSGLASKRASSASGSPSLFASATGSGSMSPTFGATASPSALRAASSTTSTPPSHSPGIMTGAGQGSNRISPSTLHPNIANGGDPLYAQRQQFQAPNRASSPFMGEGGYGIPGHHTPQRPLSRNLSRGSHHGSEFSHRQQGMESRTQLFVGNLPFRVRWQDLKDLFRKCGTVLRSDVALTLDSRSKGFGTVLFSNEQDAYRAIEMYNGYTWQSRMLDVRLDQQDPHGSIAMANASAQQAQQAAQHSHHAAMQNMANMIGMNAAQAAMAAMQHQGGFSPHTGGLMPGFQQGPGGPSSPWLAAAMAANANAAAAAAVMQHQQRAPSPFGGSQGNHLSAGMANMSIRRPSFDARSVGSSGAVDTLAPPLQAHNLPPSESAPLLSPSAAGSSSRPGTSGGSGSASTAATSTAAPASSPPVSHSPTGALASKDSVSPSTARRAPPGKLGQLPPSIFANMSPTQHLPNPPAAAEAAKAAGYKLDEEVVDASPTQSSPAQVSPSHADNAHRTDQQQQPSLQPPIHGGLANFYSHGNGSGPLPMPGMSNHHISSHGTPANIGMYRNTPSPAYANRHLFVGNIPFNCQWQDLKDLFRAAGQILRADVSLGPDGRSRGFGTVLFATTDDAMNAVQMFNGYEYQGRVLKVHFDKFAVGAGQYGVPPGYLQNGGHMSFQSQYGGQGFGSQRPSPHVMHGQLPPPQQPMAMGAHPGFQAGLSSSFVPGHQHSLSFDDNSSIPGTPIHELNLSNMAAGFPSPGFASPIAQMPRQSSDVRRAGFNSEGVAIAPIGSGAPHHHEEGASHPGHNGGPPPPLSPLSIPPRNMSMGMSMPSPGHNGMFSPMMAGMGPMSPHNGMPLMTPSMPGFSFHPFPQTPPLLPQFLSPGLGPFSPHLAGGNGHFFNGNNGGVGLSNLRNSDANAQDGTPAQSPNAQESANYFPMMMAPQPITGQRHVRAGSNEPASQTSATDQAQGDEASRATEEDEAGTPKQSQMPAFSPAGELEEDDGKAEAKNARRASYLEPETGRSKLSPPLAASNARGASLDMPRPVMDLSTGDENAGGSAIEDEEEDGMVKVSKENGDAVKKDEKGTTSGVKKGPWNLSWLKK